MTSPETSPFSELTQSEPAIIGLQLGKVRHNLTGNAQVYFGGQGIEQLDFYDQVLLRDGLVCVDMYTIAGRDDVDYAEVTIKTPLTDRSPTERGKALRFGGTDPKYLIGRTPVQYFVSSRAFMDIPISGRARWLAVDPEGRFSEGLFDDRNPQTVHGPANFSYDWVFVWIVEGSRPFMFGELCRPRFIDQSTSCPVGEDGIRELEQPADLEVLPLEFQERFALYMSGEHLRIKAA